MAVERGERDRVAEAEPVELERLGVAARVVELVRDHEDVSAATRRRISASSSSPGVIPAFASTTSTTRSASSTACLGLRRRPAGRTGPCPPRSTPPVSISRNVVPDHSHRSSLRSRVTPGVSWTTAVARRRQPVDERRLPDVGEADDRDRAGDLDGRRSSGLRGARAAAHRGGVASRGRPSSWSVDEPLPELAELPLDLERAPPCSPCPRAAGPRTSSARPTRRTPGRSCRAARSGCRGSRPGSPARSR